VEEEVLDRKMRDRKIRKKYWRKEDGFDFPFCHFLSYLSVPHFSVVHFF
jgi:hypothetical protein